MYLYTCFYFQTEYLLTSDISIVDKYTNLSQLHSTVFNALRQCSIVMPCKVFLRFQPFELQTTTLTDELMFGPVSVLVQVKKKVARGRYIMETILDEK